MAKADATPTTSTLSRRAAFAAVAGTAAGTLPPAGDAAPAKAPAEPDAELIGLCAEWQRAADREEGLVNARAPLADDDVSAEHWAEEEEVGAWEAALRERVCGQKATTVAGLKAKAGVVDRWFIRSVDGTLHRDEDLPAASLVADVLALASGGAA